MSRARGLHIVGIGIGAVLAFFAIGNIISSMNKHLGATFKAAYDKDAVVAEKAAEKQNGAQTGAAA